MKSVFAAGAGAASSSSSGGGAAAAAGPEEGAAKDISGMLRRDWSGKALVGNEEMEGDSAESTEAVSVGRVSQC